MADLNAMLTLRVRALDADALKRVAAGLDDVGAAAKGAHAEAGGKRGAGGGFSLGTDLALAASNVRSPKADMVSLLGEPIRKFAEFDQTMAQAFGRYGDLTQAQEGALRQAASDLGATTMLSAQQAAEGLFELAGAGLSAEQSIAALPGVGALAESNMLGLGQATAIAISTMSQFGKSVQDIGYIGDVLHTAANASTIELTELADTMRYVGPLAAQAGISLKETATFAAVLGNAGITGTQAGTAMRGMLAKMAAPAGEAKKALKSVGISAKEMQDRVSDPAAFLTLLAERFTALDASPAQRLNVLSKVFGQEVMAAGGSLMDALSTVDENGVSKFQAVADAMQNVDGAVASAANRMRGSAGGQLKLFESQVESLKIQMGEGLMPAVTDLMAEVSPMITEFATWARENPALVASIGKMAIKGTALLAVLGPVLATSSMLVTTFGGMAKALGLVTGPVRLAGTALVAYQAKAAGTTAANATLATSFKTAKMSAMSMLGVIGAGAAGFAFGTMIDGWIGKLFNLRGELLSTEIALTAFEAFGPKEAQYQTTQQRGLTADTKTAFATPESQKRAEAALATKQAPAANAEQVKGEISVVVEDKRVRVDRQAASPNLNLRTGETR